GSSHQYARATRVSRDDVQAGDLVWYPGHIMMSLGVPELIVHARGVVGIGTSRWCGGRTTGSGMGYPSLPQAVMKL
ncbi:MAG: hypothetical protein ACKOI3_11045, partial [Actinomycetota bacterium]